MKAVVLAYSNMGLAGLEALRKQGIDIAAVFTHEDDPGENCWFGSVKDWAVSRTIPCYTPERINDREWIDAIGSLQPDILFSFYYRKMIGKDILAIPRLGAMNLHGSYLPQYRGRCPVNWVLVKGEEKTGVTLHFMTEKPDAGDIVGQIEVPIDENDTARILSDKLCAAAGQLLAETLPLIQAGRIPRKPQDLSKGSYFGGRRPEDGRIDWTQSASDIYNLIRAVTDPYPGAYAQLEDGRQIILWWARPEKAAAGRAPGEVWFEGESVLVQTQNSAIRLLDIEVRGERLRGFEIYQWFKTGKVTKLL